MEAGSHNFNAPIYKIGSGVCVKLTARHLEILNLVKEGWNNAEIANSLGLSEETIKNHMLHIFERLNARNRTEAVIRAIRMSWLKLN